MSCFDKKDELVKSFKRIDALILPNSDKPACFDFDSAPGESIFTSSKRARELLTLIMLDKYKRNQAS